MPKSKTASRKPVRASSRASSSKKLVKKAVVGGGGRKKQGFLASLTRKQWLATGLVAIVVFGGIGAWRLYVSHASLPIDGSTNGTYALTYEQCNLRGRPFNGSTGLCYHSCASGAGSEAFVNTYMYCTNAVSRSLSSSKCASLYRNYLSDPGGCARQWAGTYGSRFAKDLRCTNNTWTYVNASSSTGYDKCVSPTTSTAPAPSTSWVWPVPGHSIGNGYSSSHMGIDIPASAGTAVKAAHSGTVVWRGTIPGGDCGTGLIVKAASGVYMVYQHINPSVSVNQSVSTTTTVGTVALLTKNYCWTGTHVHFGIQNTGSTVYNPTNSANAGIFTNPCVYLPGC